MMISIIIPVLDEPPEAIKELCVRIEKVCLDKKYIYEILLVDDGSINGILDLLKSLHEGDKRIKVLSFDKNYGKIAAVSAGLYFSKGDIILTIDSDLQYIPEELPLFIEKINEGYDAVGGIRPAGEVKLLSKIMTFYLSFLSGVKSEDYGCAYNALKREVAESLLRGNTLFCTKPTVAKLAKRPTEIRVTYNKRKYSVSKYNLRRYISLAIKHLFGFMINFKKHNKPSFKVAVCALD